MKRQLLALSLLASSTFGALGNPPPAYAASLFTPGLEAGTETNGVTCVARNVGKKAIDMTLEIFNSNGTRTAGPSHGSVDSGKAASIDETGAAGGDSRYCVMTFSGRKNDVRGSFYVRDSGSSGSIGTVQAE